MARVCDHCGRVGTIKEIKSMDLPVSGSRKLCAACYSELYPIEKQRYAQMERWKEDILRRLTEGQLKRFCREHDIPTSEQRSALAATRRGSRYKKFFTYHYHFDELLASARHNASFELVLDFAREKDVPIDDILADIDRKKARRSRGEG
jgi:hypothetical protein